MFKTGTQEDKTWFMSELGQNLVQKFVGPMLLNYVWWILHQAHQKGLQRLYFLARDGYLLREIALQFCAQFGLKIECRYLYCSRVALRTPSYYLLEQSEMDELLLQGGYQVTIRSILQRIELDEQQMEQVCAECGLGDIDPDRLLNHKEYKQVCTALANGALFHKYALEKSRESYGASIGYLQQEGLLELDQVALVDSGWTGSMQRSLRCLLQSAGFSGVLTGFYFGMYVPPKEIEDGTYLTWYFRNSSRKMDQICFSNNLFECLLPAPHGMTVGYTEHGGRYIPKLLPLDRTWGLDAYVHEVLEYTGKRLEDICFLDFPAQQLWEETHRAILRYMVHPTREEAVHLGTLSLCDDITEAYHLALATPEQLPALKEYSILRRIFRRFFKRPTRAAIPRLLWPYGTIAFLPAYKRLWYRWNIYLGEWIRMMSL